MRWWQVAQHQKGEAFRVAQIEPATRRQLQTC
jgi:hypothetical protein